jgi:hypothetical protein
MILAFGRVRAKGFFMSHYDDDRRYEQRRLDRIADEHRYEQRRRDYLADERREQLRQDCLADERRREQRRRDWIDEDNRRRDREDREKSRQETNASAMAWLRAGNAEAAAVVWGLNLSARPGQVARAAPTLTIEPGSVPGIAWLAWTGDDLSGAWVLQASVAKGFADPVEAYRGPEARQLVPRPDGAPRWYRVRSEGLSGRPGPWSDAARVDPPRPQRLAAPRLEGADDPLTGTTWRWSAVEGAAGYLLERGLGAGFVAPVEVYRGPLTRHVGMPLSPVLAWPSPRSLGSELLGARHRVKALGGDGAPDGPWSNVV